MPSVGRKGRSARGTFVARKAELAALERAYVQARGGAGQLVLVTGDAGIGKTRLIDFFESRLPRTNLAPAIFKGRCHPETETFPFAAWGEALAAHADETTEASLREEFGAALADVAPFVPRLGVKFPEFARSLPDDYARRRVFEGVRDFFHRRSQRAPAVILLDDIQWIDGTSLALLDFLARDVGERKILVVAAYRDSELAERDPRTAYLSSLLRSGQRIVLANMTLPDVGRLIRSISGKNPSKLAAEVVLERTRGNPFFVDQLTRLMASQGSWNETNAAAVRFPAEVRSVVTKRLEALAESTRNVLSLASVIGGNFDLDVLGRAADLALEAMLHALHEATKARIVEQTPRSLRGYTFSHALLRDALYDEQPPLIRADRHRKVAEAILWVRAHDVDSELPTLAHHFYEAAKASDPSAAVEYCTRAGDRAAAQHAYEEAAALYANALDALDLAKGDRKTEIHLLLRRGDMQRHCVLDREAQGTFERAARLARTENDPEALARAALGVVGPWSWTHGVLNHDGVALVEEALSRLERSNAVLRARLLTRLAHEHWFVEGRERFSAALDEALKLASAAGDPNALANVYNVRQLVLWSEDGLERRLEVARAVVSLRGRIETNALLEGYSWLGSHELERGNLAAWEALRITHKKLAEESRIPVHLMAAAVRAAASASFHGRLDLAESLIQKAFATGSPDGTMYTMLALFVLRRDQMRTLELEPMTRQFVELAPDMTAARYFHTTVQALSGSSDAAAAFAALAANDFSDLPTDLTRLSCLGGIGEACALVGGKREAHILHRLLLPYDGKHLPCGNGAAYFDSAAHVLALLSTRLESWEEAERRFVEALGEARRIGAVCRVPHIQMNFAKMLAARDRPGDRDRARELRRQAKSAASELELRELAVRIDATRSTLPPPPAHEYSFRQEGEVWTLSFEGRTVRLKSTHGLQYISTLLRKPASPIHVLELASGDDSRRWTRTETNVLDDRARDEYRRRLRELTREHAALEERNDAARALAVKAEMEALAEQLAFALGLGGRSRKLSALAERARVNVTRAIRSVTSRVARESPDFGHHLETSIRTGTFCSYVPSPGRHFDWRF